MANSQSEPKGDVEASGPKPSAVKRFLSAGQTRFEAWLPTFARYLPLFALAYFAMMALLRILLSPNLEVDEAQFVGHTGFSLGHDGWHPPLYGWLVTVALWLTGGIWVPALALVKALLLTAHVVLIWDLVRRMTDDDMAALMAGLSLAFLPQFIWMAQITLAHSVLVGAATLGILHATYLWLLRPGALTSLGLAFWAVVAVLAKYNALVFVAGLAIAMAATPAIRVRLERQWVIATVAVAALAVLPHFVWGVGHMSQTAERTTEFYRGGPSLPVDIPFVGLDGFVWFLVAILAWIGPLVLVLWLAAGRPAWSEIRPRLLPGYAWDFSDRYAGLLLKAVGISLAIMAAIVLLIDMHRFHERYLTPVLLAMVPVLVIVLAPKPKNRPIVALLALLLAVAAPLGMIGTVGFGNLRYAYPFEEMATQMAPLADGNTVVIARRSVDMANLAIRLTGVEPGVDDESLLAARTIIVVADRSAERLAGVADRVPDGFAAIGEKQSFYGLPTNLSTREIVYYFQSYQRAEPTE